MPGPIINWVEARAGKTVDGSTLAPGTPVRLQSRFHQTDPEEYVLHRVVPKPFWRFWGADAVEVSRLSALRESDSPSLGGPFRSDPLWALPQPRNQSGVATFRASSDSNDAVSGLLSSGALVLKDMKVACAMKGELGGDIPLPAVSLVAKASASRTYEQVWVLRTADDPPVQLTLLQAGDVLAHLGRLEEELEHELHLPAHEGMRDLPPDALTYFVDLVTDDFRMTWELKPEQPLLIGLSVPAARTVRAAVCLRVESLDDGSVATSAPRFFTGVRDQLVVTDLTVEMLRRESRDLLVQLADVGDDVGSLARKLSRSPDEVWSDLVEAAVELGASSVSDASALAAQSAPAMA